MIDDEPPHDLTGEELDRLHRADAAAYTGLYAAAAPTLGTGFLLVDGAVAIWNPHDDDPSFNYLFGLDATTDPGTAWTRAEAAARAGGARVFGVGVTDADAWWATPERLASLGLDAGEDELVWGMQLHGNDHPAPSARAGTAVDVRTTGFSDALFARVLNRGWELSEDHGRGRLYASTLGAPGWIHYLAMIDGEAAGGAVLYVGERVAVCAVAATDPAFRGRGAQQTLIARRLADGIAAGCDLATVETVADNASPRNFRRAGFALIDRRRIYAKSL